jgi:hypothetical protein
VTRSSEGTGLPIALLVSLLLLIGVAGIGIAAGPDVVSPDVDEMAAPEELTLPEEEPARGEETADGGSRTYLRDALGESFREDPTVLTLIPGSAAARGLPDGFAGIGQAGVQETTDTLAQQCPVPLPGSEDTCGIRTLAEGIQVAVQELRLQDLDDGQSFAQLAVYFIQPGGDLVQATLTAIGEFRPSDDIAALADQASTWLARFEDALIKAATDPRMHR